MEQIYDNLSIAQRERYMQLIKSTAIKQEDDCCIFLPLDNHWSVANVYDILKFICNKDADAGVVVLIEGRDGPYFIRGVSFEQRCTFVTADSPIESSSLTFRCAEAVRLVNADKISNIIRVLEDMYTDLAYDPESKASVTSFSLYGANKLIAKISYNGKMAILYAKN